jgi:SAM-dependent methyltransferase
MDFTAHNIRLPDGIETCPGLPLITENYVMKAALRAAALVCPPDAPVPWRVADLGSLEGGYAVGFAEAGYDAVGIEVRDKNFANCMFVKKRLGLPNLNFVQDDVRNLEQYGSFDIVFCNGLFYHMDNPAEFLHMLNRCTRKLLIIQTHISLAGTDTHEGNTGEWYTERPTQDNLWDSWINERSFWLKPEHLLATMQEAGFSLVARQYDYLPDIRNVPLLTLQEIHGGADRAMFLGFKI